MCREMIQHLGDIPPDNFFKLLGKLACNRDLTIAQDVSKVPERSQETVGRFI